MKKFWLQFWCNHSWVLHWIHLPDRAMELKTCTKCGKSEINKIIEMFNQ